MRNIVICCCLLLLACSRKSHIEQKGLSALQAQKMREDGIYFGTSKNYDAQNKQYVSHYPYLKFFANGYVISGIADDSSEMAITFAEKYSKMDSAKNGSRFSIYENKIYVEQIYSGMKHAHDYVVYRIQDPETLLWIGSSRKIGKVQETIPEPIVFHFKKW